MRKAAAPLAIALLLSACGSQEQTAAPAPAADETEVPKEIAEQPAPPANAAETAEIGTPMADRVATLGILNKRNNLSQDVEMKPGESKRLGDVILRMSACETTAPWELPQETGAFVQVLVRVSGETDSWNKVFSGWLFKNSPSLNVVEHPIYDVWVKDCAMSFPGGEAPAAAAETSDS